MLNLDFADPSTNADPFPIFARLRESDPVHWSSAMKTWVITRYEDVKRVAVANSDMSAERLAPFFATVPAESQGGYAHLMTYLGNWMVFRDPPEHTRLRRLFTKAFTSRSVKALEPNVEQIVGFLFDQMEKKAWSSGVVDWIADFAYPLPATVMMDLLGVPREDLYLVKDWSDDIALFVGTSRATADKYLRAEAGAKAMANYFRGILAKRAADPKDDIISQLVSAREDREALTDDEVIATCILLLFAGHETTTNLLGNGLYYTLKSPEQWKRVKDDPSLAESAVEEWLRYDGPSGALARVITADLDFGGKRLLKGQRLFAFVNAANRDSEQFQDADRFDIGRSPNAHLTFGHGIHFCLGAQLARLEGQIALRGLIERFPDTALAYASAPDWKDSLILRGLQSLPVRLR
ncbi:MULTISPECIES: cytochrome P450 [unclassified Bradyrhizobium]|uniref:cytochrome P450 n=1 Tax=unclassified Bradyrhizobium TaxID=2631580 RepID=UPI001BA8BAD9|nr:MULTISPECIES: cytochrome P450 [unclassified Bradyrhizobium]MBR1202996.1 cytochrome P450 [Bradyrhizobium sp. AUGA SZCCT0124]MBR1314411.1 cytochrome P450 [Bradyrhizobium sp. AUGA SZCCT0051]MBR1342571.1 cytochrome P450 [Bradyrhizobium sp. AUGA SZCCT0105]MBR1352801.1 cytochrome P450 [Bradyrhizobium sp. AUGA SZCCT0045]